MKTGTVKFFNEPKGYGFIVVEGEKNEIFVHVSGCVDRIKEGDEVSFKEEEGKRGPQAVNVTLLVNAE